jgi:hypothetical protein
LKNKKTSACLAAYPLTKTNLPEDMPMTAHTSMTRSARELRLPGISVLARFVDALDAARDRARTRAELRHRLRMDARLRRDIGLSRFDMIRLSTEG